MAGLASPWDLPLDVGNRSVPATICFSSVGVDVFKDERLDEENKEKLEKARDS